MDDAKLAAARAGNARARAALVRELQDRWFRYALCQLLSVSAARDATQEAGLRVLLRLWAYDAAADGPVDLWSMGAVVAAVRELRQLNGDAPPALAAARRAGLSADPPRYRPQAANAANGLTAVLGTVPFADREAVVLRLVGRRPATAVGGLLGTDPATVRARAAAGAAAIPGRPIRAELESCRDWAALARYPGDLRAELFRARKPTWLVPAGLGTLAASAVVLAVAAQHRRSPATAPATTGPATAATTAATAGDHGRP